MNVPLLTVEIRYEQDLVLARRRARQITQFLNFPTQDQVRIATALSELVRNVFQYTPGGRVEFCLRSGTPAALLIRVVDRGAFPPDRHDRYLFLRHPERNIVYRSSGVPESGRQDPDMTASCREFGALPGDVVA